jgi:hypothetical protein
MVVDELALSLKPVDAVIHIFFLKWFEVNNINKICVNAGL